jgi:hypothetical protein
MPRTAEQPAPTGAVATWGSSLDQHADLDGDRQAPKDITTPDRATSAPGEPSSDASVGVGAAEEVAPGVAVPSRVPPGHATREAPEVEVPVWRLTPRQRAELRRMVESGGRAQRKGIPREQLTSLAEAGYLAIYDDGTVMLTPAALRAITAEVDRRAAARDAANERAPKRSPISP